MLTTTWSMPLPLSTCSQPRDQYHVHSWHAHNHMINATSTLNMLTTTRSIPLPLLTCSQPHDQCHFHSQHAHNHMINTHFHSQHAHNHIIKIPQIQFWCLYSLSNRFTFMHTCHTPGHPTIFYFSIPTVRTLQPLCHWVELSWLPADEEDFLGVE